MMGRPLVLLAIIVLTAGCSGSSGPVALESFCGRYSELLCEAATKCDCLSQVEATYCPTLLAGQCQDDVVAPVDLGQPGRQLRHRDVQCALHGGQGLVPIDLPAVNQGKSRALGIVD